MTTQKLKFKKFCILICIFDFYILIFAFSNIAFCDEKKEEPIICNGDKIEYTEENKKLTGMGNMTVAYEDMKLSADKVEVNMEAKEVYANGNVVLTQGNNIFKADSVLYNFQNKTGKILCTRMEAPPWYGQCDKVDKVRDKEYVLGTGYISTCDRVPPHYKIRTKQVMLYLDDRIEAKNVVIYAGNIPVMYLPIYTHTVKSKKPTVTIVPGHSKEWGYYNLSAWRYRFSEKEQGKIHLDIRSQKGFASGITHNYNLDFSGLKETQNKIDLGKGIFDVYYMNEDDRKKPDDTRREIQRYRTMLRHRWQIDSNTLALAEYNKLTDPNFTKDYFYRQEYVNEVQPRTYVSLLRTEPGYSSGFLYQDNINNFFTETEYEPEALLDIKGQRLFENMPFYYKAEFSAANLTKKNANSDIDDDANRLDAYNELSYLTVPLELVSLKPYVGTRQSWYSKDKNGIEDRTRGILYTGVDTSTKFYRIYDIQNTIAGIDINSLRHIVTPLIRYKYISPPTIPKEHLANFDDIDTITHKNALTLAIENNFQTKKNQNAGQSSDKTKDSGGDVSETGYDIVDLARVVLSTDYNFDSANGAELSNIIGDLELRFSDRFLMESDLALNPHTLKFDIANFDFLAKRNDGAKLGIGHRYQKEESSEMTLDTYYPFTRKLGFHCYQRYQFYSNDLKEQEYGISYDLHCWTMDINLNSGAGSTIWVIFRLKAFPDFPIQLGSTYERPKPETIGD